MASGERDEVCFTFIWKLENISLCSQKKREAIKSPAFIVDAIQKTKWKLHLYPRGNTFGNCIGYFLHREADSEGAHKVEIEFELSFIGEDGSVLTSRGILKYTFPKGGDYGYSGFVMRENVFNSKRFAFLPRDTLTARCRIWSVGEMKGGYRCCAHTRIGVVKRSFLWQVINFSDLEPEKKSTYRIKSIENEAPIMCVDLTLTGGLSSEEIIRFEMCLEDETVKFSTLRLFLLDASGCRVECNQDEFWFDSSSKRKLLTFSFTKRKLLAKESEYLTDDTLSLHWEWAFSKGVVSEEIEEVQDGYTTSENKIPDDQNMNNENIVPFSLILNDNLKSLYDKQFLCDVKLKTRTEQVKCRAPWKNYSSPSDQQ